MRNLNACVVIWIVLCAKVVGATGPTVSAVGGQARSRDVTLIKPDGTTLRIPSSGPLANAAAQDIARDIATFDKAKSSQRPRGASPEVAEAMRRLAQESRNDAVAQLDAAYRVAQSTSSGLDTGLLGAARQTVGMLKQIVSSPAPPSMQVRTEVGTSTPDTVLHYCLRADYRRNACAWQSYTFGATMRIGLYMFRMQSDSGVTSEEQVLVLNEPTKLILRPMR